MAYPFVQARWFHAGGNRPIRRLVMHRMQGAEKGDTAEQTARYFATVDQKKSAHLCIDNNSVVECVRPGDVAFHAPPNTQSYGIEHAGTGEDWGDDAYDSDMLRLSAMASAALLKSELAKGNFIPVLWLSVDDLKKDSQAKGFTSHHNVSLAFRKTTHTDGRLFPHAAYLEMVRVFLGPAPTPTPITDEGDDDMRYTILQGINDTSYWVYFENGLRAYIANTAVAKAREGKGYQGDLVIDAADLGGIKRLQDA